MLFHHFLLVKKTKVLLAEKYDILNKILNELTNLELRHILFATMKPPKSIQKISREQKIKKKTVSKNHE